MPNEAPVTMTNSMAGFEIGLDGLEFEAVFDAPALGGAVARPRCIEGTTDDGQSGWKWHIPTSVTELILKLCDDGSAFFTAMACKHFFKSLKAIREKKKASPKEPLFLTPPGAITSSKERFLFVLNSLSPPSWISRWDEETAAYIAASGNIEVMQKAREEYLPWDQTTFHAVAQHGHLPLARWLRKHKCPWGAKTFALAAQHGQIEVLAYLKRHGCPRNNRAFEEDSAIACAVGANQIEVIRWYHDKGFNQWHKRLCIVAARRGALECLQWLVDTALVPVVERAVNEAACNHHMNVIQWIHKRVAWHVREVLFTWRTCHCAAYGGDEEMLRWLRARGCPWNDRATYAASLNGHLGILEWLLAEECPWDPIDCLYAAAHGGWCGIVAWIYPHVDQHEVDFDDIIEVALNGKESDCTPPTSPPRSRDHHAVVAFFTQNRPTESP